MSWVNIQGVEVHTANLIRGNPEWAIARIKLLERQLAAAEDKLKDIRGEIETVEAMGSNHVRIKDLESIL